MKSRLGVGAGATRRVQHGRQQSSARMHTVPAALLVLATLLIDQRGHAVEVRGQGVEESVEADEVYREVET